GVAAVSHRLDQPAARFHFARRELLQLTRRIPLPEIAADGPLHVGDHRLQTLFADFGKIAQLVDHPAALAAHAERTCLTGILRAHGPPELQEAPCLASLSPR